MAGVSGPSAAREAIMASDPKTTSWAVSKGLAREILRHRGDRRRIMARMLALVLAFMVGGLWVINDWLTANVWRFLLWWGACAALTGFLLLFACYDLLAVIREERELVRKSNDEEDP